MIGGCGSASLCGSDKGSSCRHVPFHRGYFHCGRRLAWIRLAPLWRRGLCSVRVIPPGRSCRLVRFLAGSAFEPETIRVMSIALEGGLPVAAKRRAEPGGPLTRAVLRLQLFQTIKGRRRLALTTRVAYFRQNDLLEDASCSMRSSRFVSFFMISLAVGDPCTLENQSGCSIRMLSSRARK
jgi:hypothetical protein